MSKQTLHKDQSGIVSFFVVAIIMIILSLIVLAFAQLVRREQSQTLDRQLSTQAFYAAESGINDAIDALEKNATLGAVDYDECDEFITAASLGTARQLDGPGGVISYSCLLVDMSPPELNFSSVPTDESVVVPIRSAGGTPITRLQISWEDSDGNTGLAGCPNAGNYPGQWPAGCQVGMLRIELLPFEGNRSRMQLVRDRLIAFLQPSSSGGDPSMTYAEASDIPSYRQGERHGATCNVATAPRQCTVIIEGLSLTEGYLRMRSIYNASAVTIRAFSGAAAVDTNRVDLVGAQAEIDSTGKANDVLRRVKVSRPLTVEGQRSPEFALQTRETQCKRFEIAPAGAGLPAVMNVVWFGGAAANSECSPGQTTN